MAEHIPDHAGAAYSIRETTVAWKMCRDVAGVPCARSTRVQHAAARRQQHGDMVSGCHLVIHNNTENPQTSLSLDVGARWRQQRTVVTRREDNFLRLSAVELEVIRRRPCMQVLDLRLARPVPPDMCRRRI